MTVNTRMISKGDSETYKKIRIELQQLAIKLKKDPTDAELYIKINELYGTLEKMETK